jgi:hypothetical protein
MLQGYVNQSQSAGIKLNHTKTVWGLSTATGLNPFRQYRNLDKSDDACQNLVDLCLACHAQQPNHSHIKSLPEYQQFFRKVGK